MFVSLQFKLELKREDREKLIQLMRKQSSQYTKLNNIPQTNQLSLEAKDFLKSFVKITLQEN
jgi:hypothetical protein